MKTDVTVAIPVHNGGPQLAAVLDAVAGQTIAHELLICDSGSTDGSLQLARLRGARVLEIEQHQFNHGATRNLLMQEAHGSHVALLTQDAEPADAHWLERLLAGFELASDVALVYGPYRPRASASLALRIELDHWFSSISGDGRPRVDRLADDERGLSPIELAGTRGFFTDANACILRTAWREVPFRIVSYAEDRALAIDMLRAGHAKAYMPDAAVLHSHDYSAYRSLQRCFDEWRGLHEVYGWREPADPRHLIMQLRGHCGAARRQMIAGGMPAPERWRRLPGIATHHMPRLLGAVLGSRADLMRPRLRRRLSLERRSDFKRLDFDAGKTASQGGSS